MHDIKTILLWGAMPILTVRHITTYLYKQPVRFGEHRMMLRPRDDEDQKILASELEVTPEPSHLVWTWDDLGNHIAIARFARQASELRFESTIRLDQAPFDFRTADIEDFARTYPFVYAAEDRAGLSRFITPSYRQAALRSWAAQFLTSDGSAQTSDLLVDMTHTIRRTFKHVARHEKGVQSPALTLKLASGSCRDLTVLMIETLRTLGIAARFVSGYLHLGDDDDRLVGGNTHAWVHAYVPGPGWVDFDPSSGVVGNQNLVRVAVVDKARDAIPLQGSWIGTAADHLAMKVAVRVSAANGGREARPDMG
jgi:transglutaminase-like putative cysteine protease